MWEFLVDRAAQFWTLAWGHALLVLLAVVIASVLAVAVAVLVTRVPRLEPIANAISSIGLTIPSFALVAELLYRSSLAGQDIVETRRFGGSCLRHATLRSVPPYASYFAGTGPVPVPTFCPHYRSCAQQAAAH